MERPTNYKQTKLVFQNFILKANNYRPNKNIYSKATLVANKLTLSMLYEKISKAIKLELRYIKHKCIKFYKKLIKQY